MTHATDLCDAIRRLCQSLGVDAAIAALAELQHGVVARWQLTDIDVQPRAIDRRIAARRLHVVHRGVYAVGHRRLSPEGRAMAAVLACGNGAVLSHRSAAALWGFRPYSGRPEVSSPAQHRVRRSLVAHCLILEEDEVSLRDGVPVTTVARTLLDLGVHLDRHQLEKAIREADYLQIFDLRAVELLLERYPRRAGTAHLRQAIRIAADIRGRTRSELEDRFRALLLDAHLPAPELNVTVELGELTVEADAVWRAEKLIVELDGRAAHGTDNAFERDRARDRAAALEEWLVIRLTWRQLMDEPRQILRDLRRLLRARAPPD